MKAMHNFTNMLFIEIDKITYQGGLPCPQHREKRNAQMLHQEAASISHVGIITTERSIRGDKDACTLIYGVYCRRVDHQIDRGTTCREPDTAVQRSSRPDVPENMSIYMQTGVEAQNPFEILTMLYQKQTDRQGYKVAPSKGKMKLAVSSALHKLQMRRVSHSM